MTFLRITLPTLVCILFSCTLFSQDVTFYSQTQVDAFNPGITAIQGNLMISDTVTGDPITSLANLSNITTINGDLDIDGNPSLINLNGLSGLTTINGYLALLNNNALQHIDGLSNLTSTSGYLWIENNPNLNHIDGLSNLFTINGFLKIIQNPYLNQIDGLSNVTNIVGYCSIIENGLSHINGLSSVTSIGGHLAIRTHDFLSNLDGLSSLLSIGGSLTIANNDNLVQIDGLSNITQINGNLILTANFTLDHLNGLSNITSIGGDIELKNLDDILNIDVFSNITQINGFLKVHQNDVLQNLDGFSNVISIAGDVKIDGNTQLENLNGLSNLTLINGYLEIIWNNKLTNIDPLSNITSIAGSLSIHNNNNLENINALSNLNSISGHLSIMNNNDLLNIDALSNLTTIDLFLVIDNNDLLTNIDGLSNITFIGGHLAINNNYNLLDISAISAIPSIGGYLEIKNNFNLTNVNALSNLTSINGHMTIEYNDNLIDLAGLSNISTIDGYLSLKGLNNLVSLDDLVGLQSINGSLYIEDNTALEHIDALSNLNNINGDLSISGNNVLTNIDGLSNIISTNGFLSIHSNPLLENINSLSNLTGINSYLYIYNNDSLIDLNGLSGITFINGFMEIRANDILEHLDAFFYLISINGNLIIVSNPSLTDCCGVQNALNNPGAITGSVNISNNPSACSSENEVMFTDCGLAVNINANPPCLNADNGSIQIEVFNYDSIPFNYQWENTTTGQIGSGVSQDELFILENLSEGIYNITITEPTPAVVIQTNIILTEILGSIFEVIGITSTNSSYGLYNGSIEITTQGGTAPFTYQWSGDASGQMLGVSTPNFTIPDLTQGTYSITVTDDIGNQQSVSVTLLDEISPIFPCEEPLDIVILNDVSGSVDAVEYNESQQFFVDFLNEVNIGPNPEDSRAAIVEWSTSSTLKIPMTTDITVLNGYLNMTRSFSGGTSPNQAMTYGGDYLESVARPDVGKVLILSTDGSPSQISPSLIALADEYKAQGYHIVTIAFDVAFANTGTREILRQVASIDLLAPGAPAYSLLDQDLAQNIVNLYLCPVEPGSSATVYFNRDGEIDITNIIPVGGCPFPQFVELTFTVEAKRELSLPSGMPVTFYYNDPSLFGSTQIMTWQIPCAIPAGTTETFTVTLPISTAANIFAVLNDDGSSIPPMSLPVTEIPEIAYSNNIDSETVCTGDYPTLQALKSATTFTPICNNLVIYTVNVCNVSSYDAYGVMVNDMAPSSFVLQGTSINDNGCAVVNGNTYNLVAGCCVSITYTYNASAAPDGYYGDQDVILNGPSNQVYIDFDGANTTAEDVEIAGEPDCPSTIINFNKDVSITDICEDGFVSYTFTIDNQTNIPLLGIEFTDILPSPVTWTFQPYNLNGLSIGSSNISGGNASFIIDYVEAETVATFSMDAYLGDWTTAGALINTATLQNVPDLANGGIQTMTSNSTLTNVSIIPDFNIPDTLYTNSSDSMITLDANIGGATDINWTTGGDGYFSSPNTSITNYYLGEEDYLNEEVALFVSTQSNCGDHGQSVVLVIIPVCDNMIDSLSIGDCNNSGTDTSSDDDYFDVFFNMGVINPGNSTGFTVYDGNRYYGPFPYDTDTLITLLSLDSNIYTLTFIDNEDPFCTSQAEVAQESCSCFFEATYSIQQPACEGDLTGTIYIEELEGGNGPFTYTFDNENFYALDSLGEEFLDSMPHLYIDNYDLFIYDESAPHCWDEINFSIDTPYVFDIELNEDTTIYIGHSVPIEMTSNIPWSQLEWTWSDTSFLTCSDCIDPVSTPLFPISYYLEAITPDGCNTSDTLNIQVLGDYNLYIPNVFTPNFDGHNDIFSVYPGKGVTKILDIKVFSRWGELVYEQPSYDPHDPSSHDIGWDGFFRGEKMGQGVFVYIVEFELFNGEKAMLSGDVTLLH